MSAKDLWEFAENIAVTVIIVFLILWAGRGVYVWLTRP